MRTKKIKIKELCNLLHISKSKIIKYESEGKLDELLKLSGCKYYGKETNGVNVYYKIRLIDENKKELYTMCKDTFKTEKVNEFGMYFITRTSEKPISKGDIAKQTDTTLYTINKWDKIMLDKSIISENGWAYFKIDKSKGDWLIEQCNKYEYDGFWKAKLSLKHYRIIKEQYENGEITMENMAVRLLELSRFESVIEDLFYYKIKLYKTDKDSPMYITIKDLVFAKDSTGENLKKLHRLEGFIK